jgi:hypothetical protein
MGGKSGSGAGPGRADAKPSRLSKPRLGHGGNSGKPATGSRRRAPDSARDCAAQVDELPKNNHGKVLKTELRRMMLDIDTGS